jgi:hypothetical protein
MRPQLLSCDQLGKDTFRALTVIRKQLKTCSTPRSATVLKSGHIAPNVHTLFSFSIPHELVHKYHMAHTYCKLQFNCHTSVLHDDLRTCCTSDSVFANVTKP